MKKKSVKNKAKMPVDVNTYVESLENTIAKKRREDCALHILNGVLSSDESVFDDENPDSSFEQTAVKYAVRIADLLIKELDK